MLQPGIHRAEMIAVRPDLAQRVMDCLRERFVLIDTSYTILVVNEAALPNFVTKDVVLGQNLFDAYPNLLQQGFKEIIDRVFSSGETHVEFSVRHTTVDGFTGFHNRKVLPLKNEFGLIDGALIIVENVHDTHIVREHGRLAELEYKQLIETLQLVSFELDARGTIVEINNAVKPVFGFEPTELVGKSFTSCIHVDDVRNTWHIYWQIVNLGKPFGVCNNRFAASDGSYIHMRWNIHPLFDEGGVIIGCRGVGENITADQTLLQDLREEVRTYEEVFQASPGPVMVVRGAQIVKMNRAFHKLLHINARIQLPTLDDVAQQLHIEDLKNVCESAFVLGAVHRKFFVEQKNIHITAIRIHNAIVVAIDHPSAVQ